jgi:uncharacterized glyoxalase superfamily metalloenzyme YdcJ
MTAFADRIEMQHRLFAELSRMFGAEVPLYDKSLEVNRACNLAVCELLTRLFPGFSITEAELERTSGERHGAIRIGRPDEYRWIGRFFAAFALEPHNFYDMTDVGAKSQPVIATAFRSVINPEHRVFTSLLQTDYFDPETRARIESLLATRQVFSDEAKRLIETCERQGGLDWNDANALIREGTERIFRWTGKARDHRLYRDLCDAGFKIAADIACFESHHLNHLTPNTLCMDLFTAAMKFCLGELSEAECRARAGVALDRLRVRADRELLRLLFRHLSNEQIDGFARREVAVDAVPPLLAALLDRLGPIARETATLPHSGFKDHTEGPSEDTPVLLRQDAYKALTEPVRFLESDGSVVDAVHSARFGEIEQRFYATTPKGRALYDRCLAAADAEKDRDPSLAKRDFAAYERMYARHFEPFPKTLRGLVEAKLVYARYSLTKEGEAVAQRGGDPSLPADPLALVDRGLVRLEGVRYEDFLPVSAAGIFASNLNQYGTKSTAAVKPTYTQAMLEEILGKPIVDADRVYRAVEADSILDVLERLGALDRLAPAERAALESAAAGHPAPSRRERAVTTG